MKTRFLTWALAGALVASIGVNVLQAHLCPGCPLCGRPSPAQLQDCLQCLALSPEQCATLCAQGTSCCNAVETVEQRVATVLAELQQTLRRTPIDGGRARELGRQLAALRGEAIASGVEAALRLRAVLTPEQLAVMDRSLGNPRSQ